MNIDLSFKDWMEVREKVQLIETIIDGETQRKQPNKTRLRLALSSIRSIQSKYFPQVQYSLYYFRDGYGVGNQPLARTNYRKWKRQKNITENVKMESFLNG